MARSYLRVFFDFEERTEALSETERGRLLLGMLRYAQTGETPTFSGSERILWPVFKAEIDKEIAVYETRIENGNRGGRPSKNKTEENRNKPNKTETKPNHNRTITEENRNRQEQEQEQENKREIYKDDDDDDDEESNARAREGCDSVNCFAIANGFKASFGRNPTSTELDRLVMVAGNFGFSPEMVQLACEKAAAHGARAPLKYIVTILEEWRDESIRTPGEAERYQLQVDTIAGRNPWYNGDVYQDMQTEREERRRRHQALAED